MRILSLYIQIFIRLTYVLNRSASAVLPEKLKPLLNPRCRFSCFTTTIQDTIHFYSRLKFDISGDSRYLIEF